MIAANEIRADNDGRVARYICNQCGKRSQSHGEVRCIHAAREVIQSLCGPLLKFPLENALGGIEPSAGYQSSKWQSSCSGRCGRNKALPPAHDHVEVGTIRPHDLALPGSIVGILQRLLSGKRRLHTLEPCLIQNCELCVEYMRRRSIADYIAKNAC